MQGKERNITKIDKQFKDSSWSAMRKILDQEIPQIPVKEDRRKRYILLLMILLIGFISGIGTMVYVHQQQKIEFSTPVEVEKELAESADLFQNNAAGNQVQNLSSISNIPEETTAQKTINDGIYLNNIVKNTEKSKSKDSNENSITAATLNNYSDQLSDDLESKQNGLINQNVNHPLQNDFLSFQKKTVIVDFISSKPTLIETPQLAKKLDLLEISLKKKWHFGLTLGAYSNNTKIFAGITLGGKTTFDLDRRFSIGSGLQYSILSGFKEGQSSRADANALELSNPGNDNQEIEFVLDGAESSISSRSKLPISSLHYLELPVEMAYRFSKKFQIHLGAKAGYLVKATADGYLNSNSFTYSQKLNNKDLYKSLNKFDFTATLGIGFYPLKKIGINLQYNYGLIDFTRNDVWIQGKSNINQNVQLSAVFFFGKK